MNWIFLNIIKTLWRTDVVSETSNRRLMSSHIIVLPLSEETNDEVASELTCEDLSEEVDVRNKSGLKNDWDVRSVEKLDWVWLLETSHLSAGEAELNTESLHMKYKLGLKRRISNLPGSR